jgi:outer membrane protein OmpA-like peptidoglycan-associated protein
MKEPTMKIKAFLLCTATLTMVGYSANGASFTSGPRYTPRPEISPQNYTEANRFEDYMDTKIYNEYEQREPCQHYRRLPRNYIDGCASEDIVPPAAEVSVSETRLFPIIRSYTILFDFDKSSIRPEENETLLQVMHEINKYSPRQVTVTGYTDSSGATEYNQSLSRAREQSVSSALLERGIANQTLERDARGEYDQAVQTPDNTRNQENRRVVIDFRR